MDQFASRRAYARLRITPGTPLTDWLHNTLRTRFDHVCHGNIADYEKATGTALHIEGLVKDRSDYHEKRDDVRIRGPKDYYLGWDNEEMLRSLRADKVALNEQLEDAIQAIVDQRSANDGTKTKRDLAIVERAAAVEEAQHWCRLYEMHLAIAYGLDEGAEADGFAAESDAKRPLVQDVLFDRLREDHRRPPRLIAATATLTPVSTGS